jgi:hypothetical protein
MSYVSHLYWSLLYSASSTTPPPICRVVLLTHLFFQKPADGEIGQHFLFRSFNLRMRHDGRRQRLVRMGNGVAHLCVPRGWNKWGSPLCMCVVLWRYQAQHRNARKDAQSKFMTTGFHPHSVNTSHFTLFHAKREIYLSRALDLHVRIHLLLRKLVKEMSSVTSQQLKYFVAFSNRKYKFPWKHNIKWIL